jgi:hypothetical protein
METLDGVSEMDLTGYKTSELKAVADIDAYAVRKEAELRAEKAAKAYEKAKAAMAKAMAEIEECNAAISAAYEEMAA